MSDQHVRRSPFSADHSRFTVGLAVAALAAAAYANALANGLVWDDPIVLNRQLLAFRSLHDLIFTPRNIPQYSPDYYRPVTTLSYLLDHAIGGSSPLLFHFSVVVYHIVATYLVFRFGLLLFADSALRVVAAGAAAALFAVHPIHTESVAWGAGRSDVLATCFVLGATLAYFSGRRTPLWRALAASALLFVAALAKETAVSLFVILPVGGLLLEPQRPPPARPLRRAERRRRRDDEAPVTPRWLPSVPFAIAFVIYFGLRQAALGTTFGQSNPLSADVPRQLVGAVGLYVAKLLLPIRQSAYISDLPAGPLALLGTAAVLVGVGVAGLAAWRHGERRLLFLLLWLGGTLAPSLAIVVKLPGAPVAERYLYLPSVAFCMLCGYGAAYVWDAAGSSRLRAAGVATGVLILAAAAIATVRRNTVWRSNLSLWSDTAATNTTDGLPMRSLAATYLTLGDRTAAAHCFQVALQRRNDRIGQFTIYNNLGSLAMQEKHLDEAEEHYKTALAIDPNAADCLFNLGLIDLTRALDADATHDAAWKHSEAERARQQFERAVQLSPLDTDIQVALGQTLSALGDAAGARGRYQRALELGLPPDTAAAVRKLLAELN